MKDNRAAQEREYTTVLQDVVRARRPDLLPIAKTIGTRPLSAAEREELRGVVADELTATGLRDDDEPNKRGLLLESIIDWIGHQ